MKKVALIVLIIASIASICFCLTACNKDPVKEEKKDLITMQNDTWPSVVISIGRWFGDINYQGKNLTCESKSYSAICQVIYENDTLVLSWGPNKYNTEGEYEQCLNDYCHFIVREDNHIVGYAVLNYYSLDEGNTYNYKVITSYVFPKVDGAFQEITLDYVNNEIARAIKC